jgi:hypothetical protein
MYIPVRGIEKGIDHQSAMGRRPHGFTRLSDPPFTVVFAIVSSIAESVMLPMDDIHFGTMSAKFRCQPAIINRENKP